MTKSIFRKEAKSLTVSDFEYMGVFLIDPKTIVCELRELLESSKKIRTEESKNFISRFYELQSRGLVVVKEYFHLLDRACLDYLEILRTDRYLYEYWSDKSLSFVMMRHFNDIEDIGNF